MQAGYTFTPSISSINSSDTCAIWCWAAFLSRGISCVENQSSEYGCAGSDGNLGVFALSVYNGFFNPHNSDLYFEKRRHDYHLDLVREVFRTKS